MLDGEWSSKPAAELGSGSYGLYSVDSPGNWCGLLCKWLSKEMIGPGASVAEPDPGFVTTFSHSAHPRRSL